MNQACKWCSALSNHWNSHPNLDCSQQENVKNEIQGSRSISGFCWILPRVYLSILSYFGFIFQNQILQQRVFTKLLGSLLLTRHINPDIKLIFRLDVFSKGYIVVGYRGTFAFGRDMSDVKVGICEAQNLNFQICSTFIFFFSLENFQGYLFMARLKCVAKFSR